MNVLSHHELELAKVALASHLAYCTSKITGANVVVDGGYTIH